MGEEPLKPDEQAALDKFEAWRALTELKRRHPEWGASPACPDCGSFGHFECGGLETGSRGYGKTYRGIKDAPDGSIYVVSSEDERRHCRDILAQLGRRSDSLRFLTLDDVNHGRMRGMGPDMIRIDHDVEARAQERTWAMIQAYLRRT